MPVRCSIPTHDGVFFITFTCTQWLNLFDIADSYCSVYRWFDHLKQKGHFILGYVIMPNHVHSLIAFRNTQGKSINKIIGNGKRFMAYDIIARLTQKHRSDILTMLELKVNFREKTKNKIHEVFEPSFDWKECWTEKFIEHKLDYIHLNPCKRKWSLVEDFWLYPHSSALFYTTGRKLPTSSYASI